MGEIATNQFASLPEKYQEKARYLLSEISMAEKFITPSSQKDADNACIELSKHFRPQPDSEPTEVRDGYRAALASLPAWSISDAVQCFIRGDVDNHTGQFMPTCAEFAKVAKLLRSPRMANWLSLKSQINRLKTDCEEERRRDEIEKFRNDPEALDRVKKLVEQITKGSPKKISGKQHGDGKGAEALDQYRAARKHPKSKIGYVPQHSGEES